MATASITFKQLDSDAKSMGSQTFNKIPNVSQISDVSKYNTFFSAYSALLSEEVVISTGQLKPVVALSNDV